MLTYLSRFTPISILLLYFYIYTVGKKYDTYMGRDTEQETNVLKKISRRNKAEQ